MVEEINLEEYEVKEEQPTLEEQPKEEQKQELIDLDAFTQFVAFVTSRDLPEEESKEYQEKYRGFVTPVLKMIGFNTALAQYSIASIPPWASILLGFGVMVGGVIVLKPKAPKKATKKEEVRKPIEETKEPVIFEEFKPIALEQNQGEK
jgi:hypothetical protein